MNFPQDVNIKDISVTVNSPSFYSENKALIGHARAIPASRFEVTFKTVALNPIKAREVWGFINALSGRLNPFTIVLPTHSDSLGSIINNPIIKSSSNPGVKTLTLKNLPVDSNNLMIIGDVFKCAGHSKVYVLTSALNSNSGGEGSFTFSPQLQKSITVNELVLVRNVPYSLRLRSEKSIISKKISDQGYVSLSFDTVEAL